MSYFNKLHALRESRILVSLGSSFIGFQPKMLRYRCCGRLDNLGGDEVIECIAHLVFSLRVNSLQLAS